jgi:pSer/pThr/pTyr-binding forkhead associated (FHA) protein
MNVNLLVFKKDGTQKAFPVSNSVSVIGRRPDCDMYVPLCPVSRRHCQLSYVDGVLKVRDLGSLNGTYVNGKRIEDAVVQAGDEIGLGTLRFVCQIDGQPGTARSPAPNPGKQFQERPKKGAAAPKPNPPAAGKNNAAQR